MPNNRCLWLYSLVNIVILIAVSSWLWQQNQPVNLPESGLSADAKLPCISYSPYYKDGVTPLEKYTHIDKTQIDADLQLLSQQFECVRIYSVGQGLDYVPEAASKLGMKVLLGAWIGWISADNETELNLAIKLANRYPQTVKALIVGNEVLLRGEQKEAAMLAYIERAKKATRVPVTYADVWEFWIKHKKLEGAVDYITVHLLPYWEDTPQSIENAMPHTINIMNKLAGEFSKPLFIGESGWPSAGRQRGPSIPSQLNQARYLREFVHTAQEKQWNYNLIEAIDQPWKRKSEGTVGGYWGLYSNHMEAKFAFSGPVAERHDGIKPTIYSSIAAALFLALSFFSGNRKFSAAMASLTLGALAGLFFYLQLDYLETACRNWKEWTALGSVILIGALGLLGLCKCFGTTGGTFVMKASFAALGFAAAICGLLLTLDGRYRDFPVSLYLLPALEFALAACILGISSRLAWLGHRRVHFISCATALICLALEPRNLQALMWLLIVILLAASSWPKSKA